MNHIRIDKQKAINKWSPILENMGVTGEDRLDWMSEYAEFHAINENAYANVSNVAGLGSVLSPSPSTLPGTTIGTNWSGNVPAGYSGNGSGDLGQNLLPVSMKIAAQTIGLDLVAVKPSPGPKMDLLYIDFQYDDTNVGSSDERPQVFKLDTTNAGTTASVLTSVINAVLATYSVIQTSGGLNTTNGVNTRVFTTVSGTASIDATNTKQLLNGITALQTTIGISTSPVVMSNKSVATTTTGADLNTAGSNISGVVEFLGYSRIDGFPMFRAYKQANSAQTNSAPYIANATGANTVWGFDQQRNTFNSNQSLVSQITNVFGVPLNSGMFAISLISALEDHIPGYVTNFAGNGGKYPMDRSTEENTYAGQIGPRISSKSIAVGTVEVSSALRRTEIEDIKANTGMDIVQKMESILVNELSQTISKQIVSKIFEMGGLNRASAPLFAGNTTYNSISGATIFDLDTAYVQAGPGGETTHAVQRKLITKMVHASNYLATEGRVGPAQFAVTNGALAASLMDIAGYTINPLKSKLNSSGQLYPVGQIGDIQIYVDPYMKYNDNRIVIGRKNNPDQPGIIFVPYLMAQSISIISEATFAPRMLLRSRYAVAEVGWYPQKQFMTIVVNDAGQYLN